MCNCKGKCGCNITQTTKGEKGDNGINGVDGTNAFKFVKQITTVGNESVIIPYTEITSCNPIPEGCYPTGTVYDQYIDLQVQIFFLEVNEGSDSLWADITFDTKNTKWRINSVSGDLSIGFSPEAIGDYRVVILA